MEQLIIGKMNSWGNKCSFKAKDERIFIFEPNDIKAYRFTNGRYYIVKTIDGQPHFLEFLIKGRINVYYLFDDNKERYFLQKEGEGLIEIPYKEGYIKRNGKNMFYQTQKHWSTLSSLMEDAPSMENKIKNIEKPNHQNLIQITKSYHNKVCTDEACVIYKKTTSFIRMNFDILGGFIKFNNINKPIIKDKNYLHAGGSLHFGILRTNERWFLRTGFFYSSLETELGRKNLYKLPIQLMYIFPKKPFQFQIAGGSNFYVHNDIAHLFETHFSDHSIAFSGGVNIQLNDFFTPRHSYDY